MTANFISTLRMIWMGVRESFFSWIVIIVGLILLLLAFNCFTSPVKLAKKKLKKIYDEVSALLPERKGKIALDAIVPEKDLKEIARDAETCYRMLLAGWYDRSDDIKLKNAMTVVRKIPTAIEASSQGKLREDPKAMGYLMKNVAAQADAGLKLLSNY